MSTRVCLWTAAMWSCLARLALAATPDGYDVPIVESPNYWVPAAIAAGALLAVCAVGFKNAKRTHLD